MEAASGAGVASLQQQTLITSLDPPACTNIDVTSDDVFVLAGNEQHVVCLNSFSVLRGADYKTVPLFAKQFPRDPLAVTLQRIRGLNDRLEKLLGRQPQYDLLLAEGNSSHLAIFRAQCDAIFREVRSALRDREQQIASEERKDATEYTVSSRYAKYVAQQLTVLEESYGESCISELSTDCRTVTLQYMDAGNRVHKIELSLFDESSEEVIRVVHDYFSFACSDTAKVSGKKRPHDGFHKKARNDVDTRVSIDLAEVYRLFCSKVDSYQAFYSELEMLDTNCHVLDEVLSPWTVPHRRLRVTDQVSVVVAVTANQPRSVPKLKWVGSGRDLIIWKDRFDCVAWREDRSVLENLEVCCGARLSGKSDEQKNAENDSQEDASGADCAICYSMELVDDKTGATEAMTDIQCENAACGRCYHRSCLRLWLDSLPTSRISFDLVIGSCPYCKQPIMAPMLPLL